MIENFYNRTRRHSHVGGISPEDFEGTLKTRRTGRVSTESRELQDRIGHILSDGRLDIGGVIFDTPSGAGYFLRKKSTNGWSFWLVDVATKKSLASIRREYLEKSSLISDVNDEDDEEQGNDPPESAQPAS